MGLFDRLVGNLVDNGMEALKRTIAGVFSDAATGGENAVQKAVNTHVERFTFAKLPATLDELKALPEAKMDTAYKTAALTVVALAVYTKDQQAGREMLDYLNGPAEFNEYDRQFLAEHLLAQPYVAFSYFRGATPENNYTPGLPYVLEVKSNANSFAQENWAYIYLTSGGADTDRQVMVRKKPSEGKWYYWEQALLSGVRTPVAQNPWA